MASMRIVVLPLTRVNASASTKLPRPTFYRFKITPPPPKPKLPSQNSRWLPEEGLGKWASNKANQTWIGWGVAPKGSIKQRAFQTGQRLMDQLDFEETNLKSLDLSIAPPLKVDGKTVRADDSEIPLFYPPTILSGPQSLENLRALVDERIPLHNRGMYMWIFFAVLSAPLKLIPIIPNFPFYFCAWRTWSHLKARRAAQYLKSLIENKRIVPEPLHDLTAVYAGATEPESATVAIERDVLERAVRALGMPAEEETSLLQAQDQVVVRLAKGKKKTS
ncbi:mitochondrial K+-H+ exchange-related-domain-containing protein [Mycena amicta]|nr:mitochondrial K+-H+ exchange-related-domain-containing protein [Mycena amicta]